MKIRGHPGGFGNPDIIREERIHGAAEPLRGPLGGDPDTYPLAMGMYPGISAPGANGWNVRRAETGQYGLHLPLDGAGNGLALPAGEAPSVVLGYQEDRSRVHAAGKLGTSQVGFNSFGTHNPVPTPQIAR
jgi:hypothetical protein